MTGRGRRLFGRGRGLLGLAGCLLLAPAVLAGAGCGRMPRIVVLTDPLTAGEHLDLGLAYERKGELDLAGKEYERALRKDGNFFRARLNLGNVRLAKKEYAEAGREYRKALALRPGDPAATNNLAWAAILSGEGIEEALAGMEAVLSRPQNRDATFLDTLGVLRMRVDRPAAAEEAFSEAERLCLENGDPGCPGEVLREIRDHREELRGRFPAFPAPPLVK